MKKNLILLAAAMLLMPTSNLFAQKQSASAEQHLKFYGFIRNFTYFDTRENYAGTQDLFFYAPKDEVEGKDGVDLNSNPTFNSLALTTRFGLDVKGYKFGSTYFDSKLEADFYSMNGTTAVFRMRQAYVDIAWKDLGDEGKGGISLRVGQAWSPIAADQPNVIGLETGAPFNPFSRTPQIMGNFKLGNVVTLTGGFITQMQYCSTGPNGKSSAYLRHGILPEIYAGVTVNTNVGIVAKAGMDIISIKPRWKTDNEPGALSGHKVSDRMTAVTPYVYFQYTTDKLQVKAKSTFAMGGEHLNILGGYGISKIKDNGDHEYSPMQSTNTWISACYGKKWQVLGMLGYSEMLGTVEKVGTYYYGGSAAANIRRLVRFTPTVQYNIGKFSFALEYDLTSAQYGNKLNEYALATGDLHWVTNHRLLAMVKFAW